MLPGRMHDWMLYDDGNGSYIDVSRCTRGDGWLVGQAGGSMADTLGLDDVAHAVYKAILAGDADNAAGLAALLNLPADVTQASIDQLLSLSLLRSQSGVLMPGTSPSALHSLLQRQSADLARRQQEYADTKAAVSRLTAEYEQVQGSRQCTAWERVDGIASIQARLEILARQARSECLSLQPTGTSTTPGLTGREVLDQELLRHGVTVWTVFLDSARNDRCTLAYARRLASLGGEVRTSPTLPTWLVIFDRSSALLPADSDPDCESAFEVTGPGVVTALVALFEKIWSTAAPLGACHDVPGDAPTTMERELLRLLGQGLTDDAVAKKLGIGLRTARRMVADLMCRLDARSRFEAGANAVDRGWITPCRRTSERPPRAVRHEKCCGGKSSGSEHTGHSHITTASSGFRTGLGTNSGRQSVRSGQM
jgi:DNA-binding CsgD family transcriptional regulator